MDGLGFLGIGMEKSEYREECCKRLSSGHDVMDTHMSSQQLWLLAQDLSKIKPVKNPSTEVRGTPDAPP